jgi:hypothetical protein
VKSHGIRHRSILSMASQRQLTALAAGARSALPVR